MKTSELTGAQLDYWVARAEGHNPRIMIGGVCGINGSPFRPSINWLQGGPIIEREQGGFYFSTDHHFPSCFVAQMGIGPKRYQMSGPTPLIAAMRAYVGLKYGDEVPDA